MLAFGIRYLTGSVAAAEADRSGNVEWPPHPGRVFMALAAAHFQTGADPDPEERKALEWLESLEVEGEPMAPEIHAGEAMPRTPVTHYVPVNDKPGPSKALLQSAPLTRERQPRSFARAWLADDTVFLTWRDAEPSTAVRKALDSLCAKVTRIGHSSSLVQMWVADPGEIGEPDWAPDEERAIVHLRLAGQGTLELLEQQYNGNAREDYAGLKVTAADPSDKKAQKHAKQRLKEAFVEGEPAQLRPTLSVYGGYSRPDDRKTESTGHPSYFSPHTITFRLSPAESPYRHLDLASMLAVTQRWRDALLSQSDSLSDDARAIMSGHDADGAPLKDAHLAFLPLAFVGHDHADGHLLGMGLVLPQDITRDLRRDVLHSVNKVRELKLGRFGRWRVEGVGQSRPPANLRSAVWTAFPKGATEWSTVTPVAFDHHPKAKDKAAYHKEVGAMIAQCCERIGLRAPRHVIATPVSAHLGAPPAHAFPRLRRKDDSQRRHTHAILVFDEPVCGPMILGAGRYRGYGVCRPIAPAGPTGEGGL